MLESFYALLPIVILFLTAQKFFFKISKTELRKILFGILFTFIGLSLFLLGVNAGFMNAGSIIGYKIASMDNKFFVIAIGFILGLCTILAEPAVYALTHQIEEVTSGYVKKKCAFYNVDRCGHCDSVISCSHTYTQITTLAVPAPRLYDSIRTLHNLLLLKPINIFFYLP